MLIKTSDLWKIYQVGTEEVKALRGVSVEIAEGEYVAIHNREVVDHDSDEGLLRKRIRTAYGKTPILLTPADGKREYRITSTRLTRL